jgi:leucyl aminopeptidase (aminopeptidase T)
MDLTNTFRTCLGIKKEETVLLLTDEDMNDVSGIIKEAISPLTEELIVLSISPRRGHGEELPHVVSNAMAGSDVVIGATSMSMTHTEAAKKAVKSGARVASMPGITQAMLTEGGMTANYQDVAKSAKKVSEILSKGRKIAIKTSLGTDFNADISGRKGYADTGLLLNKGDFGNLPAGEGFIAPLEDGSDGTIVFDGPIASAGLHHEPIVVEVEDGMVKSTSNAGLERLLKKVEKGSIVGEIGIGVNPEARLIGKILEDEKVLGTAHIAFGNNLNFGGRVDAKSHLDGILRRPTIMVDGRLILKKGLLLPS